MKIADALHGVTRLFLDTAPVIYFIERHPVFHPLVKPVFERIDSGLLVAVTSPVTLAECLVVPFRSGQVALQQDFTRCIVRSAHTLFVGIEEKVGLQAAQLRAQYNLKLAGSLQVAVALEAGCEAFLTNDRLLARIPAPRILIVEDLEP